MAYVFQIWLPLIIWQQVHAPQYKSGFATVLFLSVAMIILTWITLWFERREKAK